MLSDFFVVFAVLRQLSGLQVIISRNPISDWGEHSLSPPPSAPKFDKNQKISSAAVP